MPVSIVLALFCSPVRILLTLLFGSLGVLLTLLLGPLCIDTPLFFGHCHTSFLQICQTSVGWHSIPLFHPCLRFEFIINTNICS